MEFPFIGREEIITYPGEISLIQNVKKQRNVVHFTQPFASCVFGENVVLLYCKNDGKVILKELEKENKMSENRQPDMNKTVNTAFILGIVSIIAGLLLPIAGVIIGYIGFSKAKAGMYSELEDKAKKAKMCSMAGIGISVAWWIFNIISMFV